MNPGAKESIVKHPLLFLGSSLSSSKATFTETARFAVAGASSVDYVNLERAECRCIPTIFFYSTRKAVERASSRRTSDSRSTRCSPPLLARELSSSRARADAPARSASRGAATLQCLECGGITHARRVPYSEQTNEQPGPLCPSTTTSRSSAETNRLYVPLSLCRESSQGF